jgi:hypothetical protein
MKEIKVLFFTSFIVTLAFSFLHPICQSRVKIIGKSHYKMEIFEGNPFGKQVWDFVWKLPFMQPGKQGVSPTSFGDAANVLKSNILQIYGGEPSYDGAPVAEGEIAGITEGALFLGLRNYYEEVSDSFILAIVATLNKYLIDSLEVYTSYYLDRSHL